jgi:hypothetical protein
MSLSTTSGTMISQSEAGDLTANFRYANPGARKALFFGSEKIQALLVTGVIGIRIYYGIDNTGAPELVLVGVDENEDDVLKRILDKGVPCPPTCGSPNALNGLT